jgi:AraC-like DNA-binding protein
MNTAAQYLKNTDISISEAAQSVGYSDSHVFNKAFKRQFNSSPAEWRKKQLWEQSII